MDKDLNEITISGTINHIRDDNTDYIKFGLTSLKSKGKVFSSLNINRNLYETYKDFFVKGNKVFIKGYLNSYSDSSGRIQNFITVTDISNNEYEILKGKQGPHIRKDPDGTLVWDGKRCEAIPPTEKELEELNKILSKYN